MSDYSESRARIAHTCHIALNSWMSFAEENKLNENWVQMKRKRYAADFPQSKCWNSEYIFHELNVHAYVYWANNDVQTSILFGLQDKECANRSGTEIEKKRELTNKQMKRAHLLNRLSWRNGCVICACHTRNWPNEHVSMRQAIPFE